MKIKYKIEHLDKILAKSNVVIELNDLKFNDNSAANKITIIDDNNLVRLFLLTYNTLKNRFKVNRAELWNAVFDTISNYLESYGSDYGNKHCNHWIKSITNTYTNEWKIRNGIGTKIEKKRNLFIGQYGQISNEGEYYEHDGIIYRALFTYTGKFDRNKFEELGSDFFMFDKVEKIDTQYAINGYEHFAVQEEKGTSSDQYYQILLSCAKILTPEEHDLFYAVMVANVDKTKLADFMGITKQVLTKRYNKILKKLRSNLDIKDFIYTKD